MLAVILPIRRTIMRYTRILRTSPATSSRYIANDVDVHAFGPLDEGKYRGLSMNRLELHRMPWNRSGLAVKSTKDKVSFMDPSQVSVPHG